MRLDEARVLEVGEKVHNAELHETYPDEEYWTWRGWEHGDSRCPYCVDLECPRDWEATCDCFMAPVAPDDHECEVCDGTALAIASDREGEALGPGDLLGCGEEPQPRATP